MYLIILTSTLDLFATDTDENNFWIITQTAALISMVHEEVTMDEMTVWHWSLTYRIPENFDPLLQSTSARVF